MNFYTKKMALMNSLCRICGQEEKNCISVFSESGKRQEIEKKINICLPLVIEEFDSLPKQICLKCLHKLDATWELKQLCKNGQILIEKKLQCISENDYREQFLFKDLSMIDEKVRSLSESRPITVGDSAIITLELVREPTPPAEVPPVPVSSDAVVGMVAYQVPTTATTSAATTLPSESATDNVYPQGLIQVLPSSKPVLYQQRNNDVKPVTTPRRNISSTSKRSMPAPKIEPNSPPKSNTSPRRSIPTSSKRPLREGNSVSFPAPKKAHILCKYCKKTFPDEIIDHHVSLHLRQSFSTCLDCNKNFRSELAMSRHRCGTTESSPTIEDAINLDADADDDLICL